MAISGEGVSIFHFMLLCLKMTYDIKKISNAKTLVVPNIKDDLSYDFGKLKKFYISTTRTPLSGEGLKIDDIEIIMDNILNSIAKT